MLKKLTQKDAPSRVKEIEERAALSDLCRVACKAQCDAGGCDTVEWDEGHDKIPI